MQHRYGDQVALMLYDYLKVRVLRYKVQAGHTLPFLVNCPHGLALICEHLSEFIEHD